MQGRLLRFYHALVMASSWAFASVSGELAKTPTVLSLPLEYPADRMPFQNETPQVLHSNRRLLPPLIMQRPV